MSLFRKKSTKEKVEEAGTALGTFVKNSVQAAFAWAQPRAKEAADRIQPLAIDAYDRAYVKAAPLVKEAVTQANNVAHDAVDKARPYVADAVAQANVVANDAIEKARPYVADATKRAGEAAVLVREDYLPRAKRAAEAAIEEARNGSGDLSTRANAVVKASKKELAKPQKKRRGRKLFGFLAVAGAGAVAAYVAWARSKPIQDPWAEAYWEDVSVPKKDEEPAAESEGAQVEEKVTEGDHTEAEAANIEPTEGQLKAEELAENISKTREEEAAKAAGLLDEEQKDQ